MNRHGPERRVAGAGAPLFGSLLVLYEPVPARSALGSPEGCVKKVRAYVDAGCSKYVLWPISPPDELVSQIELYGREILPRFG